MASNGRVGLRSGSPSFLVVGLSLVIIVLLYSYWSVSSRNTMLLRDQSFLQERLRSLTSQKLAAEKKKSSAMAQVANMEKTKRQLEGNVMSSSKEKTELDAKVQTLGLNLETEKKRTATLQSQQIKSKAELQKLKGEIDQTSEKLKQLTKKTNTFVDMYKNVKETLAKKNVELFKVQNDWHLCQTQLKNLKEEHSALGENVDKKKDFLKGKGNTVFKQGIAKLKKQMQLSSTKPAFQPTIKAGPSTDKQKALNTPVATNTTSQTKSTDKTAGTINATTSATSTRSTNTTSISTNKQVENKHNMPKPTKHKTEVESDDENPEDKINNPDDAERESDDTHMQDEDDNHHNTPVGDRAQPIGLKLPRRTESDRGRTRLS